MNIKTVRKLFQLNFKSPFLIEGSIYRSIVNMPRKTVKSASNSKLKEHTEVAIKIEPVEEQQNEIDSVPNLNKFKFSKKTHIKVEFDKEESKKSNVMSEVTGLWEPANWNEFLVNLRIMRENNEAPVDSMGCHMAMDENAPPEVMRYQSLIALMLSSQTKDQVTFAAMERLRKRGLTVDNVLKISDEELGQLIYPVGFWKTKVKYIKKTTQTLKEMYNGDIPDSVEKLCKLTGVGPKMAHICMKVAWNKITGIGVDTHVHRISNRIGWVKKTTPTPEDTRKALQAWLPFDLWSEVNHLMVGFGQTICLPIGPLCYECLNRDICPSSSLCRKSPKKSPNKQETESEPVQPSLKLELDKKPKISPQKRKIKDEKDQDQANIKLSNTNIPIIVENLHLKEEKVVPTKKNKSNTETEPKLKTSKVQSKSPNPNKASTSVRTTRSSKK